MLKITIKSIPESKQRYPTNGDWWFVDRKKTSVELRVSEVGNFDYEFLVALHELVEMWLCRKRGISQRSVDAFDKAYERRRKAEDESEPGDDPGAPYYREHQFACGIERLMAAELGIDWCEYSGDT